MSGRFQPWASRAVFYIGKDGRILYVERDVSPDTAGLDVAARLARLGVPRLGPLAPHRQR